MEGLRFLAGRSNFRIGGNFSVLPARDARWRHLRERCDRSCHWTRNTRAGEVEVGRALFMAFPIERYRREPQSQRTAEGSMHFMARLRQFPLFGVMKIA